jgi:hypothetical protein
MSGLLGNIYSAGDRMKRKLGGLLSNPLENIVLGSTRMAEDMNALSALASEAGYMPNTVNRSDQSVLVSPQQNALARALLADKGADMGGNMAGMILYHGTNASKPIKSIDSRGTVFDGLFASPSKQSAQSHGKSVYRMTVPDEAILPAGSLDDVIESTKLSKALRQTHYDDDVLQLIESGKGAYGGAIDEESLIQKLSADDIGAADWELQRLRGVLARKLGYKAAAMPDEHGMSYLVLPGTKPRPYNKTAKEIWRNGVPIK